MKFETRQRIDGTVDEVEKALLDDRYPEFLLKHHGVLLEVKPLEKQDDGTKVRRKIRYLPKPVIGSVGPKKVPPEWFAFVESSTYDRARKELTFTNVPTTILWCFPSVAAYAARHACLGEANSKGRER